MVIDFKTKYVSGRGFCELERSIIKEGGIYNNLILLAKRVVDNIKGKKTSKFLLYCDVINVSEPRPNMAWLTKKVAITNDQAKITRKLVKKYAKEEENKVYGYGSKHGCIGPFLLGSRN